VLSVIVPVRSIENAVEVLGHIPPGAVEVLLQSGVGIAHARNAGARRARGDVLLHIDDDVLLRGDLAWFDTRPAHEVWWVASSWSTTTADRYTEGICSFLNLQAALHLLGASVGSFQPMRRSAFEAIGGYVEESVQDDMDMARRLYRAFGPPTPAPFAVVILRRTVTMPEHWKRHAARGPVSEGPFRRLVPAGSPFSLRTG